MAPPVEQPVTSRIDRYPEPEGIFFISTFISAVFDLVSATSMVYFAQNHKA
jgi:hypothetical protein